MRDPAASPARLERVVAGLVEQVERRFWGKYRGWVVDNEDPERLGRITLCVPSVFGSDVVTGWASPCSPYGGSDGQGLFYVPERDAGVWVEFEEGDLEFPIWVGTFWTRPGDEAGVPLTNAADGAEADEPQTSPTCKTIKTKRGHTLQFEDADDGTGILLREGARGHLVTLNDDGVTVTDGDGNSIAMTADGITLTDVTGNSVEMTGDGLTITAKVPLTFDAKGQPVQIIAASIDMKKG